MELGHKRLAVRAQKGGVIDKSTGLPEQARLSPQSRFQRLIGEGSQMKGKG